jgi:hypothetical protein
MLFILRYTPIALLALCGGLILFACKGKTGDTLNPAAPQTLQSGYFQLQGKRGETAVTMHLEVFKPPTALESPFYFNGVYYFDGQANVAPRECWGYVDSTGTVILEERPTMIQDTLAPMWKGKWTAEGLSGEYTGNNLSSKMPFNLRFSKPEVAFSPLELQASMRWPENADSSEVACNYSISILMPEAGDAATNTFLNQQWLSMLGADSMPQKPTTVQQLFEQNKKDYFAAYKEEMTEADKDPEIKGDYGFMYNRDFATSNEILYNANGRLVVAISDYIYTGGAHGMSAASLFTFDLRQKRRLGLEDVLKPGYEKALLPHLQTAARRYSGLESDDVLADDGYYLVDEIPFTTNVGITEQGIIFDYPPYEVAAYAAGEIRLFVPFSDIRDLMK